MGATFWSNTGGSAGRARSAEHPQLHRATDTRAQLRRIAATTYWGRTGRLTGALPVSAKMES
jgi:hypothetical protein